jgi:Flp pilus assembly protein TadD
MVPDVATMPAAPAAPRAPRTYRLAFGLGLLIAFGSFAAGLVGAFLADHRLPSLELDPVRPAREALARGDAAVAAREYRGLAAVNGRDTALLLQAAEGLVRAGDAAGGAEMIAHAWAEHPGDPRVLTALGWSFYWTKRYDEAAVRFAQALQADPSDVRAHAGLGEVRIEQQRYDEAAAELLRAVQLDPASASARNSLGVAYALSGQPERALQELTVAARLSPTADVLANLERARADAARRRP